MKKILAALALVAAALTLSPAAPVAAGPWDGYASFTECVSGPAAYQSQYICFDETTAYGPVIYIRYASGAFSTAGVTYPSSQFSHCRSFADAPNHLIGGSGVTAFYLGASAGWPDFVPNGSVCPSLGLAAGSFPKLISQCTSGSPGTIELCNNSTMFNSLRTVANNEAFWFYWAD